MWRGFFAEASHWLTQAADQGDSGAERIIGFMFLYGDGVERDPGEASSWFLAAAEQGDAEAQFQLGKLYLEGVGLSRNVVEGRRWLTEAARREHREAQEMIQTRWPDAESTATAPS